MKTLFCSVFFLGLSAALIFGQATTRPVHLRASADSPVIGSVPNDAFLMAPAEPVQLSDSERKAGWEAISFLDQLRGFVRRNDLTKDLKVAPGAAVYLTAQADPGQLVTRARANDLFEVERLAGDWVEVSFRLPVTAFVRSAPQTAPAARGDRVESVQLQDEPAARAESPRRPVVSDRSAIPSDGMLRSFQGQLSQPRALFGRQPPYPFQMVDASGNRIAYLDLSKLLITTPMEHFLGREYEFQGKAEPIEGRRDFVIRVERMFRK
jgi:hypothetical protein